MADDDNLAAAEDGADSGCVQIRVLVAVAVRFYREGLTSLLERDARLCVVAAVSGWPACVEQAENADVVLLDVSLLERPAAIASLASPVIALALADADEVIRYAESGAAGYLTLDDSGQDVCRRIVEVARGELSLAPNIGARLVARIAELGADRADPLPRLTRREREIVLLIGDGLSNKEIAVRLHIELGTVKNHVHNLLEKLGVNARDDAARLVHAREI